MVCLLYGNILSQNVIIRRWMLMEFLVLAKVGMIVNGIVKLGYCIAGGYLVKTGVKYVSDYKESLEQEKGAL